MIFANNDLDGVKSSLRLKSLTGADAMVSPLSLPPVSESVIKRHIASGARLYRIIYSKDLINLDPGNLLFSLIKMHDLGASYMQSVLLLDNSHDNGLVSLDRYMTITEEWIKHGGSFISTMGNSENQMLKWIDSIIAKKKQTATLYPVVKPDSEIEIVKDWRFTIATFPYMGYRGAEWLRGKLIEIGAGDNLLDALFFLTDEERSESSSGNLKKVHQAAREYMNLPPGINLDIKGR